MKRKVLIVLLMLALIALPLFAEDSGTGVDNYLKGIINSSQIIGIIFASGAIVWGSIKLIADHGITKQNMGFLVAIAIGVILLAVYWTLPSWIQSLSNS